MKTLSILMLALPFALACTPVVPAQGPAAEARDSFRFVGGGNATTARIVDPDLFWSSLGSVQTYNDGYRGMWRDELVSLRSHENVIEGFIGSARTELHVTPTPEGFRVDGLYRGALGELRVSPKSIIGNVGTGWVSVVRNEGEGYEYVPPAASVGNAQRALRLPDRFAELPRDRQALYLALVIGG